MNRPGRGFSLIEMLIVVAIIAVLAGVGSSYYQEYSQEARVNLVKYNLQAVREAISRFFKDRLTYPTSLEALQGAYLAQSVRELLLAPLAQNNVLIKVEVPKLAANPNISQNSPADCEWVTYDFSGPGSGNRQIRSIRINYNGSDMNW
jgi:prepilin-type N-terminal cleavage/methylation domain-containing protein